MAEYIGVEVETDPTALEEQAYEALQEVVPGWEPNPGAAETWIIQATARMSSEIRDIASQVPTTIFRYFGETILLLSPNDATFAIVDTTWTMKDDLGYTVPAGTLAGLRTAGDTLVAFETLVDFVVPPGDTETPAGSVMMQATEAGELGSGLSGAMEIIDAIDFIDSIATVGTSTGGVDEEDDDAYLNRLATSMTLLSFTPITPEDFEQMSRSVPGVERALALDGYDPVGDTYGNERMVAVAAIDSSGEDVSSGIKSQIDELLQSRREVNFIVQVFAPTYTTIDVTFTAVAYPDWNITDVEARAEQAVNEYLSPALWGLPPFGDEPRWIKQDTIRIGELYSVLNSVDGLHYVTALTFGLGGGAQAGTNVTLAGDAPLPRPGTVAGTVTEP